jgi:hypothetical protein
MTKSKNEILFDLYIYHKNQIAGKVVVELQKLNDKDFLLSGEDSGLKNVWEEICVQAQCEYSLYWETYEDTIRNFITDELSNQPPVIQELMIHINSLDSTESDEDDYFNCIDEIFDLIIDKAGYFENERIIRFIENDFEDDEEEEE